LAKKFVKKDFQGVIRRKNNAGIKKNNSNQDKVIHKEFIKDQNTKSNRKYSNVFNLN